MKHRELIIAAMDGKIIQYKCINGPAWIALNSAASTINLLAIYPDSYQYRIKPEPVPDKVSFGVIADADISGEEEVRTWMSHKQCNTPYYTHMVKLTTKTDDNGVVTEHVEIVK